MLKYNIINSLAKLRNIQGLDGKGQSQHTDPAMAATFQIPLSIMYHPITHTFSENSKTLSSPYYLFYIWEILLNKSA
jgi:hypothetical protein